MLPVKDKFQKKPKQSKPMPKRGERTAKHKANKK